jgi:carbohydrate-selective porin OprB
MKYRLLITLLSFTITTFGQIPGNKNPEESGLDSSLLNAANPYFTHEVTYTGDFVSNLRGGIQSGTTYLGMAKIAITFETQKLGLWKGGDFHLHGASTH